MKCWGTFFHDWGKWEQYDVVYWEESMNKDRDRREKRRCSKCGAEKDRRVTYIRVGSW